MSSSNIRHFTHLIVWQKSHDLALRIYNTTKTFPRDELYSLVSQLRRAAISITCNIAEGYGRYHFKDKARFYYHARGSNMEVQNLLILSHDLRYINPKDFKDLKILVYEGYKLLNGLIKSVLNN